MDYRLPNSKRVARIIGNYGNWKILDNFHVSSETMTGRALSFFLFCIITLLHYIINILQNSMHFIV